MATKKCTNTHIYASCFAYRRKTKMKNFHIECYCCLSPKKKNGNTCKIFAHFCLTVNKPFRACYCYAFCYLYIFL